MELEPKLFKVGTGTGNETGTAINHYGSKNTALVILTGPVSLNEIIRHGTELFHLQYKNSQAFLQNTVMYVAQFPHFFKIRLVGSASRT
jgi:hypothetical protein